MNKYMHTNHSWLHRHHSRVTKLTHALHWPHRESTAHKVVKKLHNILLFGSLILFGILLGRLLF